MKRKKLNRLGIVLFAIIVFTVALFDDNISYAKKSSWITGQKYIGTYALNGKPGNEEDGWHNVIIDEISSNGKVRFQVDLAGINTNYFYSTPIITAKIKKNKAKFKWKDEWGDNGTGKITFVKGGKKIKLTMKEKFHDNLSRSSLGCKNYVFIKISNKHKVTEWD